MADRNIPTDERNRHSPGPWRPIPTGDAQWKVCYGTSEFRIVCLTSQENDEANARLIAAAPDLLNALRDLLEAEKLDDDHPALGRARIAAANAIAKGEGQW